ncbi:TIGR03545 family protein [Calditrichota bacterium]
MFRWKGIIFFAVLAGFILVLSLIFTDTWLETQLENAGTLVNGAKVDIDNLDFSLFGPIINWDRLQITNPKNTMKNMIESGFCEFKVEFWPLLSKKVIIENIQLSDLRTNTDREIDGKIEDITLIEQIAESNYVKDTVKRLHEKAESTPALQLAGQIKSGNIDSIMAIMNIRSVKKIDSLQKNLSDQYNKWQQELTNLDYSNDLKEIEQKIKLFDVNKIKTIEDFRSALQKVEGVKSDIERISKEVENKKNNLQKDLGNVNHSVGLIDDWIAADYKNALSMAKLPEINTQNIAELIFGKSVVNQVTQYLGYVGEARSYASQFQSDKPEKKEPPRLKGQDIYFYNQYARPDFWIKNINLTGETENNIRLAGIVENIVSDQKQIETPTVIKVGGSNKSGTSLDFDGELNYLKETPNENFNLRYTGFALANTKISDSKLLPNSINKGTGRLESVFNLAGDKIDGQIKFTGQNLVFDFSKQAKPKNKFDEIILSVIKSISTVDFVAKIQGHGDNLKFSINSNLDDLFVSKLNAILGKELEAAKQKIKARIDGEVNKYREKLNSMIKEKEKLLNDEIKKYEQQVNEKKDLADKKKKEIEAKIEKEKSKQLDKVKDVFKL